MDVAVVFFSEFSAAKSAVWRLYKWIKRGSHGSYIKGELKPDSNFSDLCSGLSYANILK